MKKITEYFDELKEKTGSDYKSAILMGIDRATLSSMRKREQIADETAIKIAKALGRDETELLIAAAIARSTGTVKAGWEKVAKSTHYMNCLIVVWLGFDVFFNLPFYSLCEVSNIKKRDGVLISN